MLNIFTLLLLAAPGGDAVVLRAGTIHLVQNDKVLHDSAILVEDGKIVAIGPDLETPLGVREVDYGPDATIVPGFVAADSPYGAGGSADRSAAPMLRAIDNFDPYSRYTTALSGGVTTCYLNPGVDRLIAGQGAVVKVKGDSPEDYLLLKAASIQGSISTSARNTAAYWEPPLPATVDVGLGVAQPQLPHSTMGAIVGLQELFDFAQGNQAQASEWGAAAGPALAQAISDGLRWRMAVDDPRQTIALLEFFGGVQQSLVLEGSAGFAGLADELSAAGVSVIFKPGQGQSSRAPMIFISGGAFFTSSASPQSSEGKALAKDLLSASQLAEAGVRVAVATPRGISIRELLMRANLARRGGMSPENALRAITLNAAEILGVEDRVGSLAVGKDADFVILNGAPLNHETRVLATWVDGELAWETSSFSATVIAVDELHLGDGTVLTPGEVLMQAGRIVEVGRHVARPRAAKVVRGVAAMPGAIDAWGHLGLEGSSKSFNPNFDLSRIVEPGSNEDRDVAASGVTTVNMAPKSASHGSTFMTYKPVGSIPSSMILSNPAGMWLVWDHSIPSMAGAAVRDILGKAATYKKKWEEYEAKLAAWTPPAPEPDDGDDGDDDEDEDDGAEEDEDDEKKKKKKPKDKPDAIGCTGTWESGNTRLRLIEKEGALEGYLRLDGVSDLITVSGTRDEHEVSLNGQSGPDSVSLTLTQEFEENDVDQPRFEGQYTIGEAEPQDVTWPRTGTDYPMASMPERRKVAESKPLKGAPKSPGINPGLEPIRQAMLGKSTLMVSINNSEQLNECLSVFKRHGIRPVLAGSARPSSSHASLISGVLLGRVSSTPPPAGIPFMMRTRAEAEAADLLNDVSLEVGRGLSPTAAVRALTGYPAEMLGVSHRVGLLKAGRDADLVLFDGPPLHPASQVLKVWVYGKEVSR